MIRRGARVLAVGLVALLTISPVAALAQSAPTPSRAPKTNLADIEDEVMCIVCGTLLELAQESPQANRERDFIRELIAQGLTKDQIKDRLVQEYGRNVLATPTDSGFDLTAWIVPGAAVIVGGFAIVFGLRRWRRETGERESKAVNPVAPTGDDAERLDADLAKYEL